MSYKGWNREEQSNDHTTVPWKTHQYLCSADNSRINDKPPCMIKRQSDHNNPTKSCKNPFKRENTLKKHPHYITVI